jgi:hypothetical protein
MKQRRWCRGFETLLGFMRNLQEMPGDKGSRVRVPVTFESSLLHVLLL